MPNAARLEAFAPFSLVVESWKPARDPSELNVECFLVNLRKCPRHRLQKKTLV